MGHLWRSSFSSSSPPQGYETQPLRGGKGGKELDRMGWGRMGMGWMNRVGWEKWDAGRDAGKGDAECAMK